MRRLVVGLTLVSLFLAACGGAAVTDQADQITALEGRITALEAQVTGLTSEHDESLPSQAFEIVIAQYVMDTAGFHGMDESLNETMTVEPAYLSTVNRVHKVVAQAPWPEELHEQADAFGEALETFAAALEADDAETAAGLAAGVHEAQHDLSAAIDEWLGVGEGHEHGN
jgi:hypothetical protein